MRLKTPSMYWGDTLQRSPMESKNSGSERTHTVSVKDQVKYGLQIDEEVGREIWPQDRTLYTNFLKRRYTITELYTMKYVKF